MGLLSDIINGVETTVEHDLQAVEQWWDKKAEPAVETAVVDVEKVVGPWVTQFGTGIGQKLLSLALTAFAAIPEGATINAVVSVGAAILKQVLPVVEDAAKQEVPAELENLALNAARTAQNYLAAQSAAPVSTADTAATTVTEPANATA